jgi:hypothetical protein
VNIHTISAMLLEAIDDNATFEQAERMYSATFRSAPEIACNIFEDTEGGRSDFYDEFEIAYNPKLMIVELCNYKGEGEGFAIWNDEISGLPVFSGKDNSYGMFA